MKKIMVKPGFLKNGKECKNCIKSLVKIGKYCKRAEHAIVRYIEKSNTRKNVEYNFAEAIVAVCLKYPQVQDRDDIVEKMADIKCINKEGYITDLKLRDESTIRSYIDFIKQKANFIDIEEVYLLGKNPNVFPEISILNHNLKQIDSKSDVMLKMYDESWIGISVKATRSSFLTNYSIQKILSNGKELEKVKRDFLKENGFTKFCKDQRQEVNKLFYPENKNVYWDCLYKSIESEKEKVITLIKEGLCSTNTPYKVYELDGENVIDLSKLQEELYSKKIELIKKDYPYKKAAKMFYDILVEGNKKYNIEIRWKGNVFCSPQIIIQKV